MATLLLLRHAQSLWNAQGRWQGTADPALSPVGEHEARLLAPHLAPFGFSEVHASVLGRAFRTAELIAEGLGLAPVHSHKSLMERDAGDFTGLTNTEIDARFPELAEQRHSGQHIHPPNSSTEQFDEHALATVERFLQSSVSPLLVVTHGGFIRAVERQIDATQSARVPNLSGRFVELHGDKPVLGERFLVPELSEPETTDESDAV